jgi:hypothetical protein
LSRILILTHPTSGLLKQEQQRGQIVTLTRFLSTVLIDASLNAGFRIRIDLMRIRIRIRIPDPGFDDLNLKKFTAENLISIFLIENCNLLIPRPP